MTTPPRISLKSLQSAEFERGMMFVKLGWGCDLVVVASLIVSVLPGHWYAWYSALVAVAATFLKFYLSFQAAKCKESADDVRRVEMLASCLGWKLTRSDLSNLLEPFGSLKRVGDILDLVSVNREKQRGPVALAQKMFDRAQRSKRTYQAHAKWTTSGLVVFTVVFVGVCLYLLAESQAQTSAGTVLDPIVVSTVLLGVAGGDTIRGLLHATLKFRKSAVRMALLEARLGVLVGQNSQPDLRLLAQVMYFFGDYNSIVESAPLTLSSIHKPIKARHAVQKASELSQATASVPVAGGAVSSPENDMTLIVDVVPVVVVTASQPTSGASKVPTM